MCFPHNAIGKVICFAKRRILVMELSLYLPELSLYKFFMFLELNI